MPDSMKFIELPAGTLGANSIFATSEDVGGGVYSSTKINAAALGAYLNNALQYAALNTEDNTIIGAINELFVYVQNIANEYDSSSTYDLGDFVTYEGVLYKCTTAITVAEAWTSAHWTNTLVVDNFGAGGASVTLGTTVPSDSSGENGDLYVQYEALTYKVVEYFVKINNSWRKSPYSRVVALTQVEYDLITPDTTTLYIITDAQSSYQPKTDNTLATTDKTVVGAINELNTEKQDALTSTQIDGTYLSSITINQNDKELKIRKYGKMVTIEGFFQAKADISANSVISATGLTFLGQAQFVGFGGNNNSPIPFNLAQNGNITVLASIANNAWVNFCVTNILA